ncbi:hypothetical protein L1987_52592 [Smallanthus sonchifolius]|uniref:Uncharacterized protein n=1 Tax=Smallanthus sonchifolius TaxID=185202 RepID=A0ACB9EUB1_9ASTR|nr:hypothetical protein L1987_52592 [Smallanthus sonchifolius]
MSFICGSFKNQEEDDFEFIWPSPSPSRKARSHMFCCSWNKEYNNPYSNRGLDKFEALLADLDDKKRKIFTQKGSQYISFVRFVYSSSNDVKPIIVRLKDPKRHHDKDHHKQNNLKNCKSSSLPKLQGTPMLEHHQNSEPPRDVPNGTMIQTKEVQHAKTLIDKVTKNVRFDQWKPNLKRKLEEWWMPSYNLPLFVILVLVFLTFFGRSLVIICTSIAWYLIPTIDGTLENTTARSPKKIKIQHSRKPSESKVLSSPRPFFSGPMNVKQTKKMNKLMSF